MLFNGTQEYVFRIHLCKKHLTSRVMIALYCNHEKFKGLSNVLKNNINKESILLLLP